VKSSCCFCLEVLLENITKEGESPVQDLESKAYFSCAGCFKESCCLQVQHKIGGKFHLKLNIDPKTDSEQVL